MKVLIVDDDEDVRTITAVSLSTIGGLGTLEAASGQAGVELARRESPDLILLDVMMPGLDGPQTLEALRRHPETARIPVVFLTAKAMQSELERLERLGAGGVLCKPFDPITLPARVQELWQAIRSAQTPFAASASSRPCSEGNQTSLSRATTS